MRQEIEKFNVGKEVSINSPTSGIGIAVNDSLSNMIFVEINIE